MNPQENSPNSNNGTGRTGPISRNGQDGGSRESDQLPFPLSDDFVQQLTDLGESLAAGNTDSWRDDSSVADVSLEELGELADCLRLVDRVREHSPDCIADLVPNGALGSLWMDGGDECPAQIGRFEIRRKLGQGGFGLVFLAFDPRLERDVALKVPRVEALVTEQTRDRFLREGKAAASLNHPNIAAVYEAGRIGPICYIAAAYCAGGSLADYLKQRKDHSSNDGLLQPDSIEPIASTSLVLALAEAVQHAHSRGILHRDLKPSNILFDATPADERDLASSARLVDFGLAKTLDSDEDNTRTGVLLGTPAYMSPEQAEGDTGRVGVGCDIYSIGAILYELLTGAPPHKKPTELETLVAVKTEEPTPPSRVTKNCPNDLEAICLKCLEKSPDRRYRSAAELADDLRRFQNGGPVVARPITRRERWGRWVRRNPLLAALVTAVVSLVLLVAIGSTTAAILLASANKTSLERLGDSIDAELEATNSKQLAIGALYEAYKSESRAIRFSGQVGQSLDSLKAIGNAVERIPQLGLGDSERLALRNGAIASLALIDLSLDQQWPVEAFEANSRSTCPDGEYYAGRHGGRAISVRRMSDNQEVTRLESAEPVLRHTSVQFSPDRRFIAARSQTRNDTALNVWRIDDANLICVNRLSKSPTNSFDFSPDGSRIAIVHPDGSVGLLSGQNFEVSRKLPSETPARAVRFDPSGSRLAVVRAAQTDVLDIDSGGILQTFQANFARLDFSAVDWSPDGRLLAVACSDRVVRLWNVENGDEQGRLSGHGGEVTHIGFHPNGKLIATSSYDGKTKLWRVEDGRVLLEADALCTHFSRDGRWLCGRAERWRFFDSERYLRRINLRWQGIHPNGRVAIARSSSTWQLVETDSGKPLNAVSQGDAMFNRSGTTLLVTRKDRDGQAWTIFRLSVASQEDDSRITMKIGPPKEIVQVPSSYWEWALGETMLAIADCYPGTIQLMNINTGEVRNTESPHVRARWMDWSADERLLATGTWHGSHVKIWDAATGKLVADHASDNARVRFSRDAQTLVTGERDRFSFRTVGPAAEDRVRSVEKETASPPGAIQYAPDGTLVALAEKFRSVRLIDAVSLSELATMTIDAGDEIDRVEFSPDGTQLIVTARRRSYAWNLRNVRARLSMMGLDWSEPPVVEPVRSAKKELRVEIDLGEIAVHNTEPAAQVSEIAEQLTPLVETTEYDRTLQDLRQRVASTPHDAELHAELAWLLVSGPDESRGAGEVLSLVPSAVDSAPRDWKTLTALGLALARLGRFAEAAEALERAHRCPYRETPSLHLLLLAAAYHQLGNNDRAQLCYNGALEWWDLMQHQLPPWRSDQLERLQAESNRLSDKTVMIDESLPKSDGVDVSLLAQIDRASKFIDEQPDHYNGWSVRGRSLVRLRKFSAAILDSTVAIELAPEVHHAYFWRASSWMAKYDHDKAIADFTKSLSIHSEDVWPLRHLALMYAIEPQPRDLDRALALGTKAYAMEATHPEVLDMFGIVLYRHGRFEEALEHLEKSDTIAPRPPLTLYFIAMCHQRLGQPDKAQQFFLRAESHNAVSHPKLSSLIRAEAREVLGHR